MKIEKIIQFKGYTKRDYKQVRQAIKHFIQKDFEGDFYKRRTYPKRSWKTKRDTLLNVSPSKI